MELLSHNHHYHHQQCFNYCDGGGGGGGDLIYKNFRKNMEFDIFFEKLKRNRYENQKLKQKKLVEKISLNIYIDEFNDYELSEHTVREVDEFESLYLKSSQFHKVEEVKCVQEEVPAPIETIEDSLVKSITIDTSLELVKRLNSLACCKEDALYKKTTFTKKKEKKLKRDQMRASSCMPGFSMTSTTTASPATQTPLSHHYYQHHQSIYSNIIFYSQADDETVSTYSCDLFSSLTNSSNVASQQRVIPFYTFNANEDFDFNSYFLSTLKVCSLESSNNSFINKNTNQHYNMHTNATSNMIMNSRSLSSQADSQSTTDSQLAMLDDESMEA